MKKILIVSVIMLALVLGSVFADYSNLSVNGSVRYYPYEWSNIGEGIALFGPSLSYTYCQYFAASSFSAYSGLEAFFSPWVWQTGTKTISTMDEYFFGMKGLAGICLKPSDSNAFKFVPALGIYYEYTSLVFKQSSSESGSNHILDHSMGIGATIDFAYAFSKTFNLNFGIGTHYQLLESTYSAISGTTYSESIHWAPSIDSVDARVGLGFAF